MHFTFRYCRLTVLPALAIVMCAGTLRAGNVLVATPGALSLSCDTAAGPGAAATVVVKPVGSLNTNTIVVSAAPVTGGG
jgi:hypothetical protein